MAYTNPVIPGFHPDPSVCHVGEDYYLVTSTFEYFPGVPIFHSRDLVHWRPIGHCLTRRSQLDLDRCPASHGIYAPTIRHHAGRFYIVTTLVRPQGHTHFFVWSDDPAGQWSEPIRIAGGGIDPSLMFDDDGSVYFSWTDDGLCQSRLDIQTGRHLTEPRLLWRGMGGAATEGPHLYHLGDRYYLVAAEGGTEYGHYQIIARGLSPWGPWEPCPHNPILSHRSKRSPIQCTGHADLIEAHDGSWWMVFLGVRPVPYPPVYHLGRETFLAPVTWRDGWPIVADGDLVPEQVEAPALPLQPWPQPPTRDNFDSDRLGLQWNFLRNPDPTCWSLTDRPGHLRLRGNEQTPGDVASPAWVGRRQQHMRCRAATQLAFDPADEHDEAGLCVLMNDRHHYEIAVTRRDGRRVAIVRRRIGRLQVQTAVHPIAEGPVTLAIEAEPRLYRFDVTDSTGAPAALDTGETRYLSTEVAGGFTGVYLAMYATGNGRPATKPADFDWFDYIPDPNSGK